MSHSLRQADSGHHSGVQVTSDSGPCSGVQISSDSGHYSSDI